MKTIDLTAMRGEYRSPFIDPIEELLQKIDVALLKHIGEATESMKEIVRALHCDMARN